MDLHNSTSRNAASQLNPKFLAIVAPSQCHHVFRQRSQLPKTQTAKLANQPQWPHRSCICVAAPSSSVPSCDHPSFAVLRVASGRRWRRKDRMSGSVAVNKSEKHGLIFSQKGLGRAFCPRILARTTATTSQECLQP